jgi:hypothetical protein
VSTFGPTVVESAFGPASERPTIVTGRPTISNELILEGPTVASEEPTVSMAPSIDCGTPSKKGMVMSKKASKKSKGNSKQAKGYNRRGGVMKKETYYSQMENLGESKGKGKGKGNSSPSKKNSKSKSGSKKGESGSLCPSKKETKKAKSKKSKMGMGKGAEIPSKYPKTSKYRKMPAPITASHTIAVTSSPETKDMGTISGNRNQAKATRTHGIGVVLKRTMANG